MPYISDCVFSEQLAGTDRTDDPFLRLVKELSDALGPSSGLDSDEVDPGDIQRLMERYTSKEVDWARYAFSDSSRHYTRNLVDEGNGKSNLVSLCPARSQGIC